MNILIFFQNHSHPHHFYNYFIGPNPPTSFNLYPVYPVIAPSAFISPFTFIIGDVTVGEQTFIAPFVSIRADEGTPFYIGNRSNLQDGVIIHGLKNEHYTVKGKNYSVYIGDEVSCAHGSLIHGPSVIEDRVFVGFKAIVYGAWIGEGSFIANGATVTNGVRLRKNSFVPPNAFIDTQEKADSLSKVPQTDAEFAREVQRVNSEFPPAYSLYFGTKRCTCGLTFR